ncbi:uncharacterized protein LOC122192173 isoform X2 [Lagopus leucura]|uniref:uncharacterized protein LOC122192173 isoform X2 n=1 Tax=Lagopus leucura TaxID=30410 RepID=UPI001C67717E|nr:uncharacterized protein LOC122192173 isoform X2 [Lagopus leucura]
MKPYEVSGVRGSVNGCASTSTENDGASAVHWQLQNIFRTEPWRGQQHNNSSCSCCAQHIQHQDKSSQQVLQLWHSYEHGGAEREWLRNGAGTQGSHRCCVTTFLSGPCKLLLPSPASGAMLKLEESFPWLVGKMAQLQVLCPSLFLESNLLESRRAAGCLLCGCCGHFSQLRSLSPCWQRMCCATISSVEPLCSFSALAAVVPVSRCHKPDWHSLGTQTWETVKKAKASAALLRKEAKKESKKNQEGLEREGPQDTRISWNASSEVAPKAAD